jgi:hypothetical protein
VKTSWDGGYSASVSEPIFKKFVIISTSFYIELVYRVYKNLANGLVVTTRTKEQADAQIFSQQKRSLVLCYDRPKSSTNDAYII